jgi:GNAT superfamily N-acetyltransferase
VQIWNAAEPDMPLDSVEDVRHRVATTPVDTNSARMVGELDGQIVGSLLLLEMFWSEQSGGYHSRVVVDHASRGNGYGSTLFHALLEKAQEFGAERIYAWYREDEPLAGSFAERRGFSATERVLRMSRLNVHQANLKNAQGIEDRLSGEGIRIETLGQLLKEDEGMLQAVYELDQEAVRDVPSAEPIGRIPFELWRKDAIEAPGTSPDWWWIAVAGNTPAGLAMLKRQGEKAAFNEFTGVRREFRARGVARALKARTVEWSRENGIDYIYTGNDVANSPMLAVNIDMGYQPLPSGIQVVRKLSGP